MKPIARWTIGPVTSCGKKILRESVSIFTSIYPEFDRIICFNNLNCSELSDLSKLVSLYKQEEKSAPCLLSAPDNNLEEAIGCGWKLAPPRLDTNSLELFIDNDVIIRKRLPQIDEWIERGDCGLIAEGLSRKRMYGIYDAFIPQGINANAGLFGLPPGFDFQKEITEYASFLNGGLGGYNEQGLTVATIINMKNYIMVPLEKLHISEDHVDFPNVLPDAIHFVGANRKEWHKGWQSYQSRIKSISIL